jgi:Na+/proline symporter
MSNLVGGYALLAVFWGFSWISIKILSERKVTLDTFLVSRRNVGLLLGGVTTAVSWVWAGALFVSSQKAYEQGLPGLFWFTLPNASALILFSFLATRMRRIFPEGFTLPEFIGKRFDRKMQIPFLLFNATP